MSFARQDCCDTIALHEAIRVRTGADAHMTGSPRAAVRAIVSETETTVRAQIRRAYGHMRRSRPTLADLQLDTTTVTCGLLPPSWKTRVDRGVGGSRHRRSRRSSTAHEDRELPLSSREERRSRTTARSCCRRHGRRVILISLRRLHNMRPGLARAGETPPHRAGTRDRMRRWRSLRHGEGRGARISLQAPSGSHKTRRSCGRQARRARAAELARRSPGEGAPARPRSGGDGRRALWRSRRRCSRASVPTRTYTTCWQSA